MQVLRQPNEQIKWFIKHNFPVNPDTKKFGLSKYCVIAEYNGKVGVFNCLNFALVSFTKEEFQKLSSVDDKTATSLIDMGFFIPADGYDIKTIADSADKKYRTMVKNDAYYDILNTFNYAVIFTTTDCNAKCPYCFEGVKKGVDMSEKTANDLADFLIKKARRPLKIRWFGGEPLYNFKAIEIICDKLKAANVPFTSDVFTNGYLITDEIIEKLKTKANVQRFQIPIDGTEEYYNNIKNIDKIDEESPYQKVLNNVEKLVKNGLKVIIRLNFDLSNYEELNNLIPELKSRFGKQVGISIVPVYQSIKNGRTEEQRKELLDKFYATKKRFGMGGSSVTLPFAMKTKKCMADNCSAISVLPGGEIGLCEHYTNNHFIGSIYSDEINREEVDKIRERAENNYNICADCPLYPNCYRLKICTELKGCSTCNEQLKEYQINNLKNQIIRALKNETPIGQNIQTIVYYERK